MKTYTFYLKNGLTFKIKAESVKITTNITGKIVGYEIESIKNFMNVDISEIVAVVEDLVEE